MAGVKKDTYVGAELEFAEQQLESWKAYVEAHPLEELKDRIEYKPTAKGGVMPMVVASVEQQGKFIQETLKNYLALLKEVDNMRKLEEEKKIKARGVDALSPMEEGVI